MPKDLFIIDTRCHLNNSIKKSFEKSGYEVEVRNSWTLLLLNLFYSLLT